MTTTKRVLWGGGALAGMAAAAPVLGFWRSHRAAAALVDELEAEDLAQHAFVADRVAGIPEPVRRFFLRTLPDGQPLIRSASAVQEGQFAIAPGPEGWRPMHARQRFSTMPIGFVWEARIAIAPLVHTYVRDSYIHGIASTRGDVLGLYPVVNQAGARELTEGALTRFLAETAWLPTALLPGHGVTWMPVDEFSAAATLTDHGITVSARFQFNDAGDIVEIFVPDRYREVNGRYERTPWVVRCEAHEVHAGIRIPALCEAAWELPEGIFPYWRARLTDIRYTFER